MSILDFQKLKDFFNKEKITSNKKLVVYLFFVGVATIFWFLNALSQEYVTTINYPVTYSNLPKDKVLTSKLPKQLTLKVNAFGFNLLQYKLSTAFLSNSFNVNEYTNNRLSKNSTTKYLLVTSQIKDLIEEKLSSGFQLLEISPDTILFEFSPIFEKKVPIHLNSTLSFGQQFMLDGIVFLEKDSIQIKGPKSKLDSISVVETEMLVLESLNKTVKREVKFTKIDGVEFSENEVLVTIPVEQFTEDQRKVPIKVNNLPDSLLLRLFPGEVKVSYFVGLKNYETISSDQFDVRVDFNETKGNSNKITVEMKMYPGSVSNVRFYPQNVSFLIEQKKSFQ